MSAIASSAALDSGRLSKYFDRIKLAPSIRDDMKGSRPSLESLTAICMAHVEAIPFENLDLVRKRA